MTHKKQKMCLKVEDDEGRLHQEENGDSMEKNIPDLLQQLFLGKGSKQHIVRPCQHRRAEVQNNLKGNCDYWS